MTISQENIIKRWNMMEDKDLGTDRNLEAHGFASLFRQVFEDGKNQPSGDYYINSIVRGFAINEMLEDECSVVECLDLNYINITKYAAEQLDAYLMDFLGWFERYRYALEH